MTSQSPMPIAENVDQPARIAGAIVSIGSIVQLIAAFLPTAIVFDRNADPLVRLQAIASNTTGWMLQAFLFPIAFLIVAVGFGILSKAFPDSRTRNMAVAATAFSVLSLLLWLPISLGRIQLAADIQNVIRLYEPNSSLGISFTTFLPYTLATLLMIALMGVALFWSRLRRVTGASAIALAFLGLSALVVTGDWPPFLSYFFTLIMGIGLVVTRKQTS